MDLMIEAKDKEQAVFELYRKYGIGGRELFRDLVPYVRTDENAPVRGNKKQNDALVKVVNERDLAMGGEESRVYWPEGKEEWLSPPKKTRKKTGVTEEADGEMAVEKRLPRAGNMK